MIISLKDGAKLVGISIVSACAVFVCTFMINFYIDVQTVEYAVTEQMRALYDAQISMCKFVCAITGGVLGVIAAVMLIFYIKLYIDENAKSIGLLKDLGYSNVEIAAHFWVFGLSVFIGTALGYGLAFAFMPTVYDTLTIDGLPEIAVRFHALPLVFFVLAPTVVFALAACGYALLALHKRGRAPRPATPKKTSERNEKDRPFLVEMCLKILSAKKSLAFFVAFACFCFSAMVQMGVSMYDMNNELMGTVIFAIGLVLAVVTMIMSVTTLVNSNKKNVALMHAFGYSVKECALAVFVGYIPFALLGFAVGTVYQYGLLELMMSLLFKDVAGMPEYSFDVGMMFAVFGAFVAVYSAFTAVCAYRLRKISVKEIMTE